MENLSKQMPIAQSHKQTTNPEVSSAGTSSHHSNKQIKDTYRKNILLYDIF